MSDDIIHEEVETIHGDHEVGDSASEDGSNFGVSVIGDTGLDTFTRYMPGCIVGDEEFHLDIAYDIDVPCGANRSAIALKCLLDENKFDIFSCASGATMLKSLKRLKAFDWKNNSDGQVIRVVRSGPLQIIGSKSITAHNRAGDSDKHAGGKKNCPRGDILLIYDAGEKWHKERDAILQVKRFLKKESRYEGLPRVIVNLGKRLPLFKTDVTGKPVVWSDNDQKPVRSTWDRLFAHAHEVVIVVDATPVRHAGAAVSRRLSWEQTVEDTISDMSLFEGLQQLSKFKHVLIRFGLSAVLHISSNGNDQRSAQLIFAPNAKDAVFRDESKDGGVVALNEVMIASLVSTFGEYQGKPLPEEAITDAIQTGLNACMSLYDAGFKSPSEMREESGEKFLQDYFDGVGRGVGSVMPGTIKNIISTGYRERIREPRFARDRILGVAKIPNETVSRQATGIKPPKWEILKSQIKECEVSRINLGIAICRFGHKHVLNRPFDLIDQDTAMCGLKVKDLAALLSQPECRLSANEIQDEMPLQGNALPALPYPTTYRPNREPAAKPIFAPVMEFGELIAIERDEIESFRSIRNLMKLYVEAHGKNSLMARPISIAVFGSPGTGKSFAVKQIAKNINESSGSEHSQIETIECNIAQFRTVEDLGQAITRIASANNQGKVPLVFFDEFDCEFEEKPLGWLKYFLAPMHDGTFYGASQTISFGRAIFVFAGGIYRTISDFDPFTCDLPTDRPGDLEERVRKQRLFQDQKGPDFVSRLRGHINIRSINPDEAAPKDENSIPIKPIIRRALTLRGQILSAGLISDRDRCRVASVDNDILYAMLTVDHYRHGARSMEAILQMCTPIDGVIEKASLPSRAQLNMHVDAEEFFIRVHRGRYRSSLSKFAGQKNHRPKDDNDNSSGAPQRPR